MVQERRELGLAVTGILNVDSFTIQYIQMNLKDEIVPNEEMLSRRDITDKFRQVSRVTSREIHLKIIKI